MGRAILPAAAFLGGSFEAWLVFHPGESRPKAGRIGCPTICAERRQSENFAASGSQAAPQRLEFDFQPRRREFPITERLDRTIADAARIGLTLPAKASVTPTVL